tara:strand:- start:2196 stop:3449 length:1254 start_codon:yes stop_codon:yes gene_type:complete
MENRYQITQCRITPNGNKQLPKDGHDFTGGNPKIQYYESVDSPSISITLEDVLDVDQFISRYGVTGGEYLILDISISQDSKKSGQKDFKITSKHKMMLNEVRDVRTTTKGQMASLDFISVEAMVNETSRVNKRFSGNIQNIVEELLRKDKKGIRTDKKLEKDKSFNKYTFVGNLKRPFDTIDWLCAKAAATKNDCGFLFFETLDGFQFRSINKLLKQKVTATYKRNDRPDDSDFNILENRLDRSNDIGMNLRSGMYANRTIYVNLESVDFVVDDFKISELDGIKNSPKLPNKLEDFPTRLMFRALDTGALQKGSTKNREEKLSELAKYQNRSYARANLLFSQSLCITVPFNTLLRAGQMVKIEFPYKDESNKQNWRSGKKDSTDNSGKYLISKLKHDISDGRSHTVLTLIRDTFTAK